MTTARTDAMLTRLETEIEERSTFINQIAGQAQDADRDLTDSEHEMMGAAKNRIEECERQLTTLSESRSASARAIRRVNDIDREFSTMRSMTGRTGEVEYRSAGAYIMDLCKASQFQDARERLDVYHRTAAHNITTDIPGLLPALSPEQAEAATPRAAPNSSTPTNSFFMQHLPGDKTHLSSLCKCR